MTILVDVTDPTGRFSFFYSTPYEKAVIDAVITALKPGDVFVDVGAHLGYFFDRGRAPRRGRRARRRVRTARARCATSCAR